MDQALNSQKTPHTSPLRASYGMSFVSILMKNDRVIKGFYCILKKLNTQKQGTEEIQPQGRLVRWTHHSIWGRIVNPLYLAFVRSFHLYNMRITDMPRERFSEIYLYDKNSCESIGLGYRPVTRIPCFVNVWRNQLWFHVILSPEKMIPQMLQKIIYRNW